VPIFTFFMSSAMADPNVAANIAQANSQLEILFTDASLLFSTSAAFSSGILVGTAKD
jgi:hypothetical protein